MPRVRRQGVGGRLLAQWIDENQPQAVHVGVNRANVTAIAFWNSQGFEELTLEGATEGRTIWLGRRA